jgi:hypothetical protein
LRDSGRRLRRADREGAAVRRPHAARRSSQRCVVVRDERTDPRTP